MTAPAFVQSATASGSGTATVTLNSVTAGNTILISVIQSAAGTRTYSATDYTSEVANNGNSRVAAILRRFNAPSGTNTVTVNANTGTLSITVYAVEVEPLELVTTGSSTDPGVQTTHDCASTGLDVTADAFLFGVGVLTATGSTNTPATGYTRVDSGGIAMVQYRRSDSGVTADKATWTSVSSRLGTNVLAAYKTPAGGVFTLTADNGSFTLTGQAANLLDNRLVVGDNGSFSISGQDAGLLVNRSLVADSGSYTLTGQDATLTKTGSGAYSIAADQGSFALSGQAANLLKNSVLAAVNGSYTVTGQDAVTLASRRLTAANGSYVLSGQSADLNYSAGAVAIDGSPYAPWFIQNTEAW